MIPNAVHGAEIGGHCAKILCVLLGQKPLGGRFYGPVAESADLSFCANAEHGERMALVLLVVEV